MDALTDRKNILKDALAAIEDLQSRLEAAEGARNEPIAIVGMSFRFPGGADASEKFWAILRGGVDAIREVPPDRWDIDSYYDPDPEVEGKIYTRHGGFLDGVDQFDAGFFGIAPREAVSMDPQHRLLLEATWDALENSALVPEKLAGTQTGVFVGITSNDYVQLLRRAESARADAYRMTGNCMNFAAGRLAYTLGLNGPTMALDTACSSSLVAVHLAAQSLRMRECNLALAGGVNLILSPEMTVNACKARMLSPHGRCKTFDEAADGFVRSEGCAVIVLKRLSDALASNDNILALIRGSAVNHDGQSSGLTVPNRMAQEAVIQHALTNAGIQPNQVSYVEAHGTGTPLGDPIEVRALLSAYGRGRSPERPLTIGSLKTNVGHMESAAGIGGLIKTVLALQNQEIPPHIHFQRLNPGISFSDCPVVIPTKPIPWVTADVPRRGGVSSFGASGTNAHVILEEAPARADTSSDSRRPFHLFCVSAKSEAALTELARRHEKYLSNNPSAFVGDVCFTANAGRSHFAHRLAIVATSSLQLRDKLAAFLAGREAPEVVRGEAIGNQPPKIAFLFTGQGSQYVGMGRQLYETSPVFRTALDRCAELLRSHSDKSLLSLLYPREAADSTLDETAYTQPALFALEYALAELWKSWGIQPSAVLGHSVGEYVAACVAGVFSLKDGLNLIAERGRLMQALPRNGAMAVVFAGEAEVAKVAAARAHEVSIAAINGPDNVVVSGSRDGVQAVLDMLESQGIRNTPLRVSHAFHSPLMEPMLYTFECAAAAITYAAPQIRLVSNVTGRLAADDDVVQAAYWRRHVREPVQFFAGMRALGDSGCDMFVEIGPQPTLVGMGKRFITDTAVRWLPSLRQGREDWQQILETLAGLYTRGADVDWPEFHRDCQRRPVRLPTYPFQRQRFWVEAEPLRADTAEKDSAGPHPFLRRVASSPAARDAIIESSLSTARLSYLEDHRVREQIVLPLTAYLEIVLAAARAVLGANAYALEDVVVREPLLLPERGECPLQLVLTPREDGGASFQLVRLAKPGEHSWKVHAAGRVARITDVAPAEEKELDLEAAKLRCREEISVDEFYRRLARRGMRLGPCFRGVDKLWRSNGAALAQIKIPLDLEPEVDHYEFHPALFDSCLQAFDAALAEPGERPADGDMYLPLSLERLRLYKKPTASLWSSVVIHAGESRRDETFAGDVNIFEADGTPVAELKGLMFKRAGADALKSVARESATVRFYQVAWKPLHLKVKRSSGVSENSPTAAYLIFADNKGVGAKLGELLTAHGAGCIFVSAGAEYAVADERRFTIDPARPEDFERLLRYVYGQRDLAYRGVVHLWNLDARFENGVELEALERAHAVGTGSVVHLAQALIKTGAAASPRLWVVTESARRLNSSPAAIDIAQAPAWGLGKVVALEHPELRCARIDLEPGAAALQQLFEEVLSDDEEDEIVFRDGVRYVARLAPCSNDEMDSPRDRMTAGEQLQLKISTPGVLDGLVYETLPRRAPVRGEVEISVEVVGLNFRDVLNALGMYPGDAGPLGWECAGTVAAVGEGVDDLKIGAAVVAIAPGAFSNFVTTRAALAAPKPDNLTFAEAATIPSAFLTAFYTLVHLAHLSAGEKVLIHSAAGGVGLAAVQVAQRAGAEIFATAGSPEKRELLKDLGVEHVFDSRSLEFAEKILELTSRKGIDVVLNSLAGDFIPKSMSLLNSTGRFLEIGKRDIWDEGRVARFKKIGAYHVVDLGATARDNPELVGSMLREIIAAVKDGGIKPLSFRVFSSGETVSAFRHMQQARHVGKIVIAPEKSSDRIAASAESAPPTHFSGDASYLVTGGLSGLGLCTAQWMAERGAGCLVLMGRSAPSAQASAAFDAMKKSGARVEVYRGDVADEKDVARVIDQIKKSLPPLRGIIHSAAVLDDGSLLQQSWARFIKVMAPKARGAWLLSRLTQDLPLDFFVVYSSMASLVGSRGQSNYAAANAFLDGLCHYRRAHGQPATSIQWGPWSAVGAAAERDLNERLLAQGIHSIRPEEGLQVLDTILAREFTEVGVLAVDWPKYAEQFSGQEPPRFLTDLLHARPPVLRKSAAAAAERWQKIAGVTLGERRRLLCDYAAAQALRVLGLDSSHAIKPDQPLHELGLDSLMAVELRNLLGSGLELKKNLPATLLFDYPTLDAVVDYLAREVLGWEKPASERAATDGEDNAALADLEGLSDEDAEVLLLRELESDDHPRNG